MFDGEAFGQQMVEIVRSYVDAELAPLKAENADLRARIAALEERPAPEKGEKGEPGERGTDGQDGRDGIDGKDAAGIVDFLKSEGELVLTLQDGRVVRTGIRDGEKGQDGRDGFGFDDMDACVLSDDRTIELSFRRGDEEKCFTFKWPTPVYRGVFKQGEEYQPGDLVTWGGSLHHCNAPTTEKPDVGPWQVAAKKGRDGKDARG